MAVQALGYAREGTTDCRRKDTKKSQEELAGKEVPMTGSIRIKLGKGKPVQLKAKMGGRSASRKGRRNAKIRGGAPS